MMTNSLLLTKAVKAYSLKQLSFYLLTGREIVMLPKNFFNDAVKTADDIVKYLNLTKRFTDTILINEAGIPVNKNNIDKILLNKLPGKIRLTIPVNEKGEKDYKVWFYNLLTLQDFTFDKVERTFEIEMHDDTFYSAGVIEYKTIKYLEFIPKKNIVIETKEKDYVLGNELGIRNTYNINGKVIYAKPLIEKLHFNWLIDGKLVKVDEYERAVNTYCDRIIEKEEAEYEEAPDFLNDYPLSPYQMMCKMAVNLEEKVTDYIIEKIDKVFGFSFKHINNFLDFVDTKREAKLEKDLAFLDNKGLINLIKMVYKEAPTESLDDEHFGNSIYFEDTVYDSESVVETEDEYEEYETEGDFEDEDF